jgi:hypothetical protein
MTTKTLHNQQAKELDIVTTKPPESQWLLLHQGSETVEISCPEQAMELIKVLGDWLGNC